MLYASTTKIQEHGQFIFLHKLFLNLFFQILLTNDINLRNKANLNGIPVCSANEITSKISLALNNLKSAIILEKMTNLCNIVIRECAQKAYGEAWSKMPICQPSSKSLPECIATFTKYWFPVFQEVVMKQFRNAIDELSAFITKHTSGYFGCNIANLIFIFSHK